MRCQAIVVRRACTASPWSFETSLPSDSTHLTDQVVGEEIRSDRTQSSRPVRVRLPNNHMVMENPDTPTRNVNIRQQAITENLIENELDPPSLNPGTGDES